MQTNDLYRIALEVQTFLAKHGLPNCLIGGVAVLRWGNPRQTVDFDLCVLTGWEGTDEAISLLCDRFPQRIADARAFAQQHRVLLLKHDTAPVPFDISLGALPFEEDMIARATRFEFTPGIVLNTCSAEDLVVMKCFAGRPVDRMDIVGIVRRQGSELDAEYINSWLAELQQAVEGRELLKEFEMALADARR